MATQQNFAIRKGRTETITVTVTGVDDWTGILAKLVAVSTIGNTPDITLTGVVEDSSDEVVFTFLHDTTDDLTSTKYYYEIILYKADKSYIKDTNYGIITITETVVNDPTE